MHFTLTIVRGLPGSGKSTYARKLSAESGTILIEPDALLVSRDDYDYTPDRYAAAIRDCIRMSRIAANFGADLIYADVLPTIIDVEQLVRSILSECGAGIYAYRVIDMPHLTVEESVTRNQHQVLRDDIERMAAAWEPWSRSWTGEV